MATVEALKLRYPEFVPVDDARVQYWLDDAQSTVDASWGDDRDRGAIMLAAHNLARGGALSSGGASIPAGVTSFKSGTFSVSFSDTAATQSATGGYATTRYGQEFAALLRTVKGGPMLAQAGAGVPPYLHGGWAGLW